MTTSSIDIRPAELRDAARITEIYNAGIEGREATFETRLREVHEIEAWFREADRPFLVSERDGVVVGWARSARYSPRSVYDGVAEHAVYVDPAARGAGHGQRLLAALCDLAERAGIHKLTSRVLPENEASRRAHASVGFIEVGVHPRHARLDGDWRDTVVVERLLGAAAEPATPELDVLEARTKVRLMHPQILGACLELRDLAASLHPWRGRPIAILERPHERLMAAIFARSFTTYWSAVELASSGFGHQAAMLNRSLVEDMVDLHWITIDSERAITQFRDHELHSRMLTADAARESYGDMLDREQIPTFDENERKRLDDLFGPHGERSWTGLNVHKRVAAIAPMWGDRRDALQFYRRVVHRDNNQLLHLSALAMQRVITSETDDSLHVKIGPQPIRIDQALIAAFWVFAQMLDLMIKVFDLPVREQFERIYMGQMGVDSDGGDHSAGDR